MTTKSPDLQKCDRSARRTLGGVRETRDCERRERKEGGREGERQRDR